MSYWNIGNIQDNALGLAYVASDINSLVSSVLLAFQESESFVPIWEFFDRDESIGRSVVQFQVSAELFDVFFNSPFGYRAFFRRGTWLGNAVNALIVAQIKFALLPKLPERTMARLLKADPELTDCITIENSMFLRSLDPSLSKVWYSTAVVDSTGGLRRLPSGISDKRIDVGLQTTWMKICQDPSDCIIEVKGAFVGTNGLFQVKDPEDRARTLSERGEA